MLKKIWKIFLGIAAFLYGAAIALDWYYYVAFERRIPRWICWLIGIVVIPINWLILIVIVVIGKGDLIAPTTNEVIHDVIEAREN